VALEDVVRLLVSCPDTRGIVAAISAFLFGRGANIVTADQHSTDIAAGRLFLRRSSSCAPDTSTSSRSPGIRHSFLPAVVGGNPYRRAHDRGVKRIGATAHYATTDLDEGPIIEQDLDQNVLDLARIGRDIERVVLARAVAAHLDDRVPVFENRTGAF
jgi:formyltetrahydrofolate hydrolase